MQRLQQPGEDRSRSSLVAEALILGYSPKWGFEKVRWMGYSATLTGVKLRGVGGVGLSPPLHFFHLLTHGRTPQKKSNQELILGRPSPFATRSSVMEVGPKPKYKEFRLS